MVVETQLLAQRADQQGRLAQVVPRQARKQVVLYLKLQTAMEPIQPCRTAPVHGPMYLHSCVLCHLCYGLELPSETMLLMQYLPAYCPAMHLTVL